MFFARRADRHGRRRLLLASIAGYTLATAATALAPDIVAFGICQFCARAFLALEVTLTWTVLAEELPAGKRGYGFGVLAMLDATGAGAGALACMCQVLGRVRSWSGSIAGDLARHVRLGHAVGVPGGPLD